MTLRGRLLWSFSYLIILAVVALAIPLGINVQRRARADLEAEVAAQALVIAASLPEIVTGASPRRNLQPVAADYAEQVQARVIVVDAEGVLLADSDAPGLPPRDDYSNRPEIATALAGQRVLDVRHSSDLGTDLLVVAAPVLRGGEVAGAVRLSETTDVVDRRVRLSWLAIGAAGAFVVAGGLGVAWAIASSLARPLRELRTTAARLGSGELSARAPEAGPADMREVASTLNRMAADLERTLSSQRDFTANASHQLRTPLTGLRLRLESIERAGGPRAADAAAAIREVDRLNGLVEDLLQLARAGGVAGTGARIDLADAVHAAGERWAGRVAEAGQTLSTYARPAGTFADPEDIAMALDNLIENAVHYCPAGTRIAVSSNQADGAAVLRVADDGPGIPPEDLPKVRDRFYRGRTGAQAGPGTGLGLAIVDELAARWGGRLELSSDGGTEAAIVFPLTES